MNSTKPCQQRDFFQTAPEDIPSVSGKSLVFKLRGFNIPAFKNSKMILGIRKQPNGMWLGTPFIATKTDYRQTMEKGIRSLILQFIYATKEIETGTLTGRRAHYLICSLLPGSDTWKWLNKITITHEQVPAGQEGADITVTKL